MELFSLTNKNKRAQAWSLDLVIASVIFLIGVIVLYVYAINYTSQSSNNLDELFYEGNLASHFILSDDAWGILTDGKIDQDKLDAFDCSTKKQEMSLTKNFYFILDDTDISCTVPTDPENIVKITRITIFNNKPTKFELFTYG